MKIVFRILICIVAVVFLIWFSLAAFIYRVVNTGNILGVMICGCLIFRFGFKNAYIRLKKRFYDKNVTRIVFKAIIACWAIFGVYAVIISALMVNSALNAPPNNNTKRTLIVLGAQVKPWGPSSILQQRIDAAEKYLNENSNAYAVLSGGKGDDEPVSEAQSMYDNINIKDKSRLLLEDKSTNTNENLKFSKRIIEENRLSSDPIIVTDSYHQFRAQLIARKAGLGDLDGIYSICTENGRVGLILYPTFFVREWVAIPVEIFKS